MSNNIMSLFKMGPKTDNPYANKLFRLKEYLGAIGSIGTGLVTTHDAIKNLLDDYIEYIEEVPQDSEESYLYVLSVIDEKIGDGNIKVLENLIDILENTEEFLKKELR